MENKNKLVIFLALFSMLLYPLSDLLCIVLALSSILLSVFVLKDKDATKKVLQPLLIIVTVFLIRGSIHMIFDTIDEFASLSNTSSFNLFKSSLYHIIDGLCMIYVLVMAVVILVLHFLKKDVPVYGKMANKIVENTTNNNVVKTNTTENKTEQIVVEPVEEKVEEKVETVEVETDNSNED